MITAYVFVIMKSGIKVPKDKFLKLEGVKEVAEVYGKYDLIIKVMLSKLTDLQKFILNLRKIKGVEKTITMICAE